MTTIQKLCERRRHEQEADPERAREKQEHRWDRTQLSWWRATFDLGWPTMARAAKFLGVHRAQIAREAEKGRLITNGRPGRACRIEPTSLLDYNRRRQELELDRADR